MHNLTPGGFAPALPNVPDVSCMTDVFVDVRKEKMEIRVRLNRAVPDLNTLNTLLSS